MLNTPPTRIYDMPIVQAIFEGNVIQLSELLNQREEVNAQVRSEKGQIALVRYGLDVYCDLLRWWVCLVTK